MSQTPVYDLWKNLVATPLCQEILGPSVIAVRSSPQPGPVHIKDPNQMTLIALWERSQ